METRKVDGTTRRCMTGAICHAPGASEVEIGSNPIIDEAIQIVSSLSRTDRMHRYRLSMFALQACPECVKQMSDTAESCPDCGDS